MAERINPTNELNKVRYGSFSEITAKMNSLASLYSDMPTANLIAAFGSVGYNGLFGADQASNLNPYLQNRRVKGISSLPKKFKKDDVEEMVNDPDSNEQPLREVEHALEYTSYPLFHTREVYQSLLTYHSYIAPFLTNKEDAKRDDFWREWKLLEKLRTVLQLKSVTHEITGQTLQEGKVFYYPRISVDKAHNKINHAFLQQLPSDYTKIIGFNNKSKYTLAFNLMYFTKMGTDVRQFGDLFIPYLQDFNQVVYPKPKGLGTKLVYASKTRIDLAQVKALSPDVEAYCQNGQWFYWVALPIDKVFTFEIDDVNRNAVSPFVGLLIDMLQLSQLEQIQLEILQNPLVAILTGEIPYFETKDTNTSDQYKLSNAGLALFQSYWYQLTNSTNTGGIGLYAAPFKNMSLETLPEAPNATNIVSNGYQDTMNKAGLGGLIPTASETRAGLAQISLMIESQFPKTVYRCMERMMNVIIESLNLKYDFRFHMFGDLASDDKVREETKKDMTLGILPAAITYNALYDRSIIEDIAWSDAIYESGLLDRRMPLVTSYSAKNGESGLPPKGEGGIIDPTADPNRDVGGRPETEDIDSEGKEGDVDSPPEGRLVS